MKRNTIIVIFGVALIVTLWVAIIGGAALFWFSQDDTAQPIEVVVTPETTLWTGENVPIPQPREIPAAAKERILADALPFARAWEREMGQRLGWYDDDEAMWLYEGSQSDAEYQSKLILAEASCDGVRSFVYNNKQGEVWILFKLDWHRESSPTIADALARWDECSY